MHLYSAYLKFEGSIKNMHKISLTMFDKFEVFVVLGGTVPFLHGAQFVLLLGMNCSQLS